MYLKTKHASNPDDQNLMTILAKRLLYPVLALTLTACPWGPSDNYEFEYEIIVTDIPVNLEGINSRYDDYNSALPYPAGSYELYFSKRSGGNDFDITKRDMSLSYHTKDDVLDVHCSYPGELYAYETMLFDSINTSDDQLGPHFLFGPAEHSYFFYADDKDGDFDIKFTHHLKSDFGTYRASEILHGPDPLVAINSDQDDLYPCITEDQSSLYFCSNRDSEHFNIYNIPLPAADSLHAFFTSSGVVEPELKTVLSGNSNDKCPFLFQDVLVFTSDREGGQGGFDLYYSLYKNGAWTDPVNFGPKINTEYDEFRPILFSFHEFDNLMIFSSDRPGGKGGFDLYMVKADGYIIP